MYFRLTNKPKQLIVTDLWVEFVDERSPFGVWRTNTMPVIQNKASWTEVVRNDDTISVTFFKNDGSNRKRVIKFGASELPLLQRPSFTLVTKARSFKNHYAYGVSVEIHDMRKFMDELIAPPPTIMQKVKSFFKSYALQVNQ